MTTTRAPRTGPTSAVSPPFRPGFGPNIRTVMQIVVAGTPAATAPADDFNLANLTALQAAFASDAAGPGVFAQSQEPIVVGQTAYNSTYNTTFPAHMAQLGHLEDLGRLHQHLGMSTAPSLTNLPMKPKAIHDEMGATFDDYGRMSAKLGLEVPFTNAAIANFILQNYRRSDDGDRETRRGPDLEDHAQRRGHTPHPLPPLRRAGAQPASAWDGFIRLPDPNELGWKDTVRMNPLEDTIVALRPIQPPTPFVLPNSVRPLNPTQPLNSNSELGFSQIDITDGGALVPPHDKPDEQLRLRVRLALPHPQPRGKRHDEGHRVCRRTDWTQ